VKEPMGPWARRSRLEPRSDEIDLVFPNCLRRLLETWHTSLPVNERSMCRMRSLDGGHSGDSARNASHVARKIILIPHCHIGGKHNHFVRSYSPTPCRSRWTRKRRGKTSDAMVRMYLPLEQAPGRTLVPYVCPCSQTVHLSLSLEIVQMRLMA